MQVAASMTVVSYRRSTKVSYRDFVFNYHDDVEGCASLLKEEKNHYVVMTNTRKAANSTAG